MHWDSKLITDTTKARKQSRTLIDLQFLLRIMSLTKYLALYRSHREQERHKLRPHISFLNYRILQAMSLTFYFISMSFDTTATNTGAVRPKVHTILCRIFLIDNYSKFFVDIIFINLSYV